MEGIARTDNLVAMIWTGSQFVLGGVAGTILTSSGITWTDVRLVPRANPAAETAGNKRVGATPTSPPAPQMLVEPQSLNLFKHNNAVSALQEASESVCRQGIARVENALRGSVRQLNGQKLEILSK